MRTVVLSQNIDFAAERFFNVWKEATDDYSGKRLDGPGPNSVPGQFGIRVSGTFWRTSKQ